MSSKCETHLFIVHENGSLVCLAKIYITHDLEQFLEVLNLEYGKLAKLCEEKCP